MLIADAQVHVWGPNTPQRPWRAGRKPHREAPLGTDELLREMDAVGVTRAVLVPPNWDSERNDLVLDAARVHPDRFAVMGRINIELPDTCGLIATWRRQPGMLGLRCSFTLPHWFSTITEGRVDWLWEEAEKAGVPIMVHVPQAMLQIIDGVAERYPGLKLAVCHLALPSGKRDEEAFRDFDKLLVLARRPNVMVKASALPVYTTDGYPYRRVHPYLRRVYEAFGPRRMFWGSDFSRLPCSYREAVTMFTEEIPWFTTQDREWIMGRGLCEWLGWK